MIKRLEEAISAVSKLPEADQDVIAKMILEKIGSKAIATQALSLVDIESLKNLYTFREPAKFLHVSSAVLPKVME